MGKSAAFSFLRELTDEGWMAQVCEKSAWSAESLKKATRSEEELTLSCEVLNDFSLVLMAKLGATAAAMRAESSGRLWPLTLRLSGMRAVPPRLKLPGRPDMTSPPPEMRSTPALSSDWRMCSLIFWIMRSVGLERKFSRAKLLAACFCRRRSGEVSSARRGGGKKGQNLRRSLHDSASPTKR